MTNKRLDRKFMSCVWGFLRLFPLILFFALIIFYTFQYKNVGYTIVDGFVVSLGSLLFDGISDIYLDYITIDLLPNFMQDIYYTIYNYFYGINSYFIDFIFSFVFYQVWISILQILFNVIMILPNITNYFIEKFNHLGNKGDY